MRWGLVILAEQCEEWSVKVNVNKCGVMHLRGKGVKRYDERLHVGGEEIKLVEEYKYLGAVVDEYLAWIGEKKKGMRIMDSACCDEAVARAVESLWKKRFVTYVPIPHQT